MAEAAGTATVSCPIDTCTETIGIEIELVLGDAGPRPPDSIHVDLSVKVKGLTDQGAAHVRTHHPEMLVWT